MVTFDGKRVWGVEPNVSIGDPARNGPSRDYLHDQRKGNKDQASHGYGRGRKKHSLTEAQIHRVSRNMKLGG